MAIPKMDDDLEIISKLGDIPGSDDGLSTQQLKNLFDRAGLLIKNYINTILIPKIESSVDEDSLLPKIANELNKKLSLSGGTMKGPINMNSLSISGLNEPTSDTQPATKKYADTIEAAAEKKKLTFFNKSVSASSFRSDSTYTDYPYRAAIYLSGVTSGMIPEVIFAPADAMSGNFASVAAAYNGGIYIYAAEQPSASITIPTILCWKGE